MCKYLLLFQTKALALVSFSGLHYNLLKTYLVRSIDFMESICNKSFGSLAIAEPNSLISMKDRARFWWLVKIRIQCEL